MRIRTYGVVRGVMQNIRLLDWGDRIRYLQVPFLLSGASRACRAVRPGQRLFLQHGRNLYPEDKSEMVCRSHYVRNPEPSVLWRDLYLSVSSAKSRQAHILPPGAGASLHCHHLPPLPEIPFDRDSKRAVKT